MPYVFDNNPTKYLVSFDTNPCTDLTTNEFSTRGVCRKMFYLILNAKHIIEENSSH